MNVVYDAGALIAADRGDQRFWARHRSLLKHGVLPLTTAPVVAQVSRSPRQVQLQRLLVGCEAVPFTEADMHAVGALLAASGTRDVVDGHVAHTAIRSRAAIVTSDPDDFRNLLATENDGPPVHRI